MDLLKRRDEILERHRSLEKTRNSGWHPADLGALEREQRGEAFLSDRLIAFQQDDQVVVVGPCAVRVREALTQAQPEIDAASKSDPVVDLFGYGEKWQRNVLKSIARVLSSTGDTLTVITSDWNYLLDALRKEGVQVMLTSV